MTNNEIKETINENQIPETQSVERSLLLDNSPEERIANVVDCPMGAGKTSAAIRYIQTAPADERIVYAAPYDSEAQRIYEACPEKQIGFVEAEQNRNRKKAPIMQSLVTAKRNISCTHSLLDRLSQETIDGIRDAGYTLIIDEALDILQPISLFDSRHFDFLLHHGCFDVDEETGLITFRNDAENKACYSFNERVAQFVRRGNAFYINKKILIWQFPIEVLNAFKRVIVMGYMMDAQPLYYYLLVNGYRINDVGVHRLSDGTYEFCDRAHADGFGFDPKEKIHVLDKEKLNRIGHGYNSLSSGWYSRSAKGDEYGLIQLGLNVSNVQKNVFKCSMRDFMWTCYSDEPYMEYFLKTRLSKYSFVACNCRASNDYRDRHYLAYAINLFEHPTCYNYFKGCGYTMDMNDYSLSMLLQWIWRSAIRDGEEIYVYIPSERMRIFLLTWIEAIHRGGGRG